MSATAEPIPLSMKKRGPEGGVEGHNTKRTKTGSAPMEVDNKSPEQLEQEARNKAFLEQKKKTTDTLVELGDSEWLERIYFSDPYSVKKYESRRIDVGVGPPRGNNKRPPRVQCRARGRLDPKYGYALGQWGANVQINVTGEQAVNAAAYNDKFTETAIKKKWHPQHKNLLKDGLPVLKSKMKGAFRTGAEKMEYKKDDKGNKIPDPDEPDKFLMQPHDPPQTFPTAIRVKVPDDMSATRIVDQHGNPIELSEELNGMACIATFELTFIGLTKGDLMTYKRLVALRVNTEDRLSFGSKSGGGSNADDDFF